MEDTNGPDGKVVLVETGSEYVDSSYEDLQKEIDDLKQEVLRLRRELITTITSREKAIDISRVLTTRLHRIETAVTAYINEVNMIEETVRAYLSSNYRPLRDIHLQDLSNALLDLPPEKEE